MSSEIAEKTIAVIANFKEIDKESITLDTRLKDLDMDSLDALNLVFELEEAFDVVIPDENAFETETVSEMVSGIEKLLEAKASGSENGEEE
jgi:acyl carrier protein